MSKLISIAIIIIYQHIVYADPYYSINALARSYPGAINLSATAAVDKMLWGEYSKETPFYGYYRLGVIGGGAPNYGAFLQIAPIAPVIIGIQQGYTHRFTKIATLNCDVVECKGMVSRTDYSIKILGGYGEYFTAINAGVREIKTPDSSSNVGLEQEIASVPSGYHRYSETILALGYKITDEKALGFLINSGEFVNQNIKNSSSYLFYRFMWEKYNVTFGVGQYTSNNQNGVDGPSAVFSMTRSWGEKLSLF
jgi:hypothetical protein